MNYTCITLDQRGDGVAVLTIDRPKALNALNSTTIAEIREAALKLAEDPGVRVLLVTGGGEKAFVAGADIREMHSLGAMEAKAFAARFQEALSALESLRVPVIAVVNGYCLGGGLELALACDWIVASEDAVLGLPEVGLGVIPGGGGTQRLARLVGRARAMDLLATGRQVKAQAALDMGLVNTVHPKGELMEEAMRVAEKIASNGPLAVKLVKEAVHRGLNLDLDSGCAMESQIFGLCFSTSDQKEGMGAFIEKRPPRYEGR